ncbi:MAG: DUF4363 family protein [Clostridia bacterium]|nr:DUF4363 family protein [Clostridia bacterium]MDD4376155.1 DUF4363 family protein [Clostridia bacterium]
MKQIVILIAVFVIVIIAGTWELSYIKDSSNMFLSDINDIKQIIERDDYEDAQKQAKQLKETWKDIRKSWSVLMDDSHMDRIEEKVISFVYYVHSKEEDKAKHGAESLVNEIKQAVNFQELKAENVF